MKILVVDDLQSVRRVIVNLLFSIGFTDIHQAADGKAALAKIESGAHFDLLITDWNMPVMTGMELVKAVRSQPQLQQMKILMITAEAKREGIVMAAQAGINGYILKPFSAATLKEKIEKIFGAHASKKVIPEQTVVVGKTDTLPYKKYDFTQHA